LLQRRGVNFNSPQMSGRHLAALVREGRFAGVSGRYFEGLKEVCSSELSYDERRAAELWEASVRFTQFAEGAGHHDGRDVRGDQVCP